MKEETRLQKAIAKSEAAFADKLFASESMISHAKQMGKLLYNSYVGPRLRKLPYWLQKLVTGTVVTIWMNEDLDSDIVEECRLVAEVRGREVYSQVYKIGEFMPLVEPRKPRKKAAKIV